MKIKYFATKGRSGYEKMSQNGNNAYKNPSKQPSRIVQPSNPQGQNEVFASVNGSQPTGQGIPPSFRSSTRVADSW